MIIRVLIDDEAPPVYIGTEHKGHAYLVGIDGKRLDNKKEK